MKYCEPFLREIIARQQPDVIVEDNVVIFPALTTSGAPFVRIVSCNPLEMKGSGVAPTFSGLPADDDSEWSAFRDEYERTHRDMWTDFNDFVVSCGADPLPDLDFMPASKHANLYVFPEEADYVDRRPLDATWHRLDSSVRSTDEPFEVPAQLTERPEGSGLIYLSLGSLGSADVDLMKRLIDVLGKTRHRFIVSKGPQHTEYELADNMWGAEFLPQTSLIPLVDLVITHGGNNTTTEALHFGKPMVLLPLFWDQYDNAQRMDELGFGRRLRTYEFTDDELAGAVDGLLADTQLRSRMDAMGAAIRARRGQGTRGRRDRAGRAAASCANLTRRASRRSQLWLTRPTRLSSSRSSAASRAHPSRSGFRWSAPRTCRPASGSGCSRTRPATWSLHRSAEPAPRWPGRCPVTGPPLPWRISRSTSRSR